MKKSISPSTLDNWKRLRTSNTHERLKARANKTRSTKTFIPLEYLTRDENEDYVLDLVDYIRENDIGLTSAIHALGINMLKAKKIPQRNPYAQKLMEKNLTLAHKDLLGLEVPDNEHDFLGLVYQCFQKEGKKNLAGSYYTPDLVTKFIQNQYEFTSSDIVLDPCCGSGSFLISLPDHIPPEQIIGIDNDPIAVAIAKYNLLQRFPQKAFEPKIFLQDFLTEEFPLADLKVDYIVTNPPWGAKLEVEGWDFLGTKESFSLFLARSLDLLTPGGKLTYILPTSFLKVKAHREIRKYVLENFRIDGIHFLGRVFTGVVTDCIALSLTKTKASKKVRFFTDEGDLVETSRELFYLTENVNILPLASPDETILKKVFTPPYYTLEDSLWGLGVVTGDNKRKLSPHKREGWEPIYTGKEILAYSLEDYKNYIHFDRTNLQQVAPDEIYRAKEKLVYRFISKGLVFAYDASGSLFLNSANILIPRVPGMRIKTVLAFLNSNLMQYVYLKLFDEIKILRGNLSLLPFPRISPGDDLALTQLVSKVLEKELEDDKEIQEYIYDLYGLTQDQVEYIETII